jgi:hypothetical protein
MTLLSVVALLQDMPEFALSRGQVGTIVEDLAPGVYEVEFIDDEGTTYACVRIHASQLMGLHYSKRPQLA